MQQSQLTKDCFEILQTEGLRAVKIIGLRVVTNNADAGVITTHLVRDNDCNDEVDVYVPVELIDDTSETKTVDNVLHYLAENSILVGQENSESITQSSEQNVPISQNKASSRTRKRKRNTEQRKKVTRKRLRNSGQEYVTERGTVCAAKRLGPSCSCRRHCFNVLTDNQCDKICSDFWKMGDFDYQNAYLFGQIKCYSPVRRRANIAHDSEYLKQHTFAYYVKSSTSHDVRVCKKAFLSIHGLHQNAGRLENILTQITTGSGIPKQDSRGKHHNRPNRTAGDVVKFVKDHISSFPVYQSHYSRRDNINRVYLGEDLNIAKMHRLYTELGIEKNWPKVKPELYRRIFCEEFNIGFKLPQIDTCKVCDQLQIQINAASDSQKPELESRLAEHKKKAESAFTLLHQFSKHSSENPNDVHVICFDLQQALPTPKLSTGPAFYKRKLWTYNLCVHNSGSNKATMFVWPETIAGRGANEIASCLLHYFNNTTIEAKILVVFSDNCSGQNKNFTILSLWQYLVAIGKFEEILHIFPVSGHTMMPCDRDFGDIERVMRKRKCIYSPTEYIQLIAEARTKNPFKVVEMTSSDFVTVSAISKLLTKRTETVDKDKVDYRLVSQFRILSERPQWLEVRFSHDETESWKAVNLQKRGRPTRLKDITLQPILNGAKSVPKPKVDDVRSLLPYIPPIHHSFYNSIVTDKVSKGIDVEILDDYESE